MTRRQLAWLPFFAVALLLLASYGISNARAASSGPAGAAGGQSAPTRDEAIAIARAHLQANRAQLGLTEADITALEVGYVYTSRHNGVTHVYLQQYINGIEVFNAIVNVNVMRDGTVLSLGNRAVPDLAGAINTAEPAISPVDAVESAARELDLALTEPLAVVEGQRGEARATVLSDGGISRGPIPVGLKYQPVDGAVRLAWELSIDELSTEHYWSVRVDAVTGAVLSVEDYVDHDHWQGGTVVGSAGARSTMAEPHGTEPVIRSSMTHSATYNVFPVPLESPYDGDRQLITAPAVLTASPHGWHDITGDEIPDFTWTQGNNAFAYKDGDANDAPDPGTFPSGGADLVFDFPLDLTIEPTATVNIPAIVTNLFYWNNIMHDWSYLYGFTEEAGNFQANNFLNGGVPGDFVRAEAQDGSGTNNANFQTLPDGVPPRMQMYIWLPPLTHVVDVHAPAAIAGEYPAAPAGFGPEFSEAGTTGDVVLVDDGTEPTTDGCEEIQNADEVSGNIALLDRGTCDFDVKVRNAEDAGAIAAIVINNVPGDPISMGTTDNDPVVSIPSVMISQDNGQLFKEQIAQGQTINVTIRDTGVDIPKRDSDLDSGVIAHEYGHGISNRLTGGPQNTLCLGNQEQMGEGWSDWMAVVITAEVSDTPTTGRGLGAYLRYQDEDGPGIRPAPYTTDMTINPYTYENRADSNISIPHGVGFIWNTMLWEMYWNLVGAHGFNPDIFDPWNTGGNNLAHQLVMDGMKLQPCNPGFEDGRNAILEADVALTGGANQCLIWQAFAKRGLGFSADQGSSASVTDGEAAFDMPEECQGGPTAVALSGLDGGSRAPSLPLAAVALLGLVGAAMVWKHRRSQA